MRSSLFTAGILLLTTAACSRGVRAFHTLRVPYSQATKLQSSELTAAQEELLEELCPFGPPKIDQDFYRNNRLTLIVREGYALLHDDQTKTPIWVCERVRRVDANGPLVGRDDWAPDPLLCNATKRCERGAVDDDYSGSGYDRGHLAPNGNQKSSAKRKRETFYFSNAAPQVGAGFNQMFWKLFERDVASWTDALGEVWTVSGVLYYDEKEEHEETADGYVTVETIGEGGVFVPTHFYKVVVWEAEGGARAFAVVAENKAHEKTDSFRNHIKPVRWLEERLAVDFMPRLAAPSVETEPGSPFQ